LIVSLYNFLFNTTVRNETAKEQLWNYSDWYEVCEFIRQVESLSFQKKYQQ